MTNGKQKQQPPTAVQLLDAPQAIEQITRGEVEIQAMLAIRNPRDPGRAMQRTLAEATADENTAADCFYAIRKGGKLIEGASIRLCEIAARNWGNLRCGSRVVDVGDTLVTSQGYAWDLETNYVVYQERQRRITDKTGARYGDDMIVTTANAAASIAFREAVTKTIGKTKLDVIFEACKKVAVGDSTSMADKWRGWVDYLAKASIDEGRVLLALGLKRKAEVTPEDLIKLQGFVTALRDGEVSVDTVFPQLEDPATAVPKAGSKKFGGKPKPRPEAEKDQTDNPAADLTPEEAVEKIEAVPLTAWSDATEQLRHIAAVDVRSTVVNAAQSKVAAIEEHRRNKAQEEVQSKTGAAKQPGTAPGPKNGDSVPPDPGPDMPVWDDEGGDTPMPTDEDLGIGF